MSIMALLGSSRDNGNSEQLIDLVTKGIEISKVHLRHKNVLPIVDQRHEEQGFTEVNDDFDSLAIEMLKQKTLIFATPVYWYSMSGHMKNFVDRWSQAIRTPHYNFKEDMKGKVVYLVATGGPKVKIQGLPLVMQFKYICDFMGMEFGGYILGRGPKPGEVLNDESAVAEAKFLNKALRESIE